VDAGCISEMSKIGNRLKCFAAAKKKFQIANLINMSCYLGPFWIFPYLLYRLKDEKISLFHIRQGFGLLLAWIIFFFMMYVPLLGILMVVVILFVMPILAIIGIRNAFNANEKELPFIGELFSLTLKNFK
jgi:uncharacterized membrane protein